MGKRRKKYGWLYHEDREAWLPPDGRYEAQEREDGWVVWLLEKPYSGASAVLLDAGFETLRDAVDAAEQDRG